MTDRNRNPSDRPLGEDAQPEPSNDAAQPAPSNDETRSEPGADEIRPESNPEQSPSDAAPDDAPAAEVQPEPTEDEVWRDLVSRLEGTSGHLNHGRDSDSSLSAGPARPAERRPAAAEQKAVPSASDPAVEHDEHLGGPRDYSPQLEPDGFIPEEPASLAGAEPLSVLAWVGAIGAPLALLFSALFWRTAPWVAVLGMILVFLASTAYLLIRLPTERDDDGDDGAIV